MRRGLLIGVALAGVWVARRVMKPRDVVAEAAPSPEVGDADGGVLKSTFRGGSSRFGSGAVLVQEPKPHYFTKVPEFARDEINRRGAAGMKGRRGGREIPYTATTIALLTAIIRRIDRKQNIAQISYVQLLEESCISSRTTLADHLHLLENDLGYIDIRRAKASSKRNAVNIYRLRGDVKRVVTGLGESAQVTGGVRLADCLPESTECMHDAVSKQHSLEDAIEEPLPESVGRVGMDAHFARTLVAKFGRDRVDAVCAWVAAQDWASNPAGVAVQRIRDTGWQVPEVAAEPQTKIEPTLSEIIQFPTQKIEDDDMPEPIEVDATQDEEMFWNSAYQQMGLQLPPGTFDMYLKGMTLLSVEDGVYRVGVRSENIRQQLQHRMYGYIRRLLTDSSGDKTNEIEFVVMERTLAG